MTRHVVPLVLAVVGGMAAASADLQAGKHAAHRIETRRFVLEFSVPPQVGKTYASLCEKGYDRLRKVFRVGEDEVVWEGKCQVYLFRNRNEFTTFATAVHGSAAGAMSGGYTRINKKDPDIVLFFQDETAEARIKLEQTIVHEMTHVFLQLFHREVNLPLWVHEGFAQYFEFRHYAPRSRKKYAMQVTKAMVKAGRSAPLAQFLVSRFSPADIVSYSQAWSLIDFMAATSDRRKRTGDFVLTLKKTLPGDGAVVTRKEDIEKLLQLGQMNTLSAQEAALKDNFGISLARFESEWKRYVLARY